MRTLTLKQLTEAHACEEQVKLFKKHFGASVEVTELLAESLARKFDFGWAGEHLLGHAAQAEYLKVCAAAGTEYLKAHDAAGAEYQKVCAAAWSEYQEVRAAAGAEYQKVCDVAWAELEKATKPPRDKYDKVRAVTFARLYIADQT